MEFIRWLQDQCYQTFIQDDRWKIYFLKGLDEEEMDDGEP